MNNKMKILLIEDDEDDYLILLDLVEEAANLEADVVWKSNADEGLALLKSSSFDVCLVDYRLGARTGLEVLVEAKSQGCTIPLLIMTGQGDQQIDQQAMKAGAADYLIKGDLNSSILERSLRYSVERHHGMKALQASEQRFALAVSAANDVVWDMDFTGNRLYLSERYHALLGLSPDEVGDTPEDFYRYVHPEDIENLRLSIEAHQRGSSSHFEVSHRMISKDGTHKWIINRGKAIRSDQGTILRMAGTFSDITEKKSTELALGESEAKFRQAQKLEAIGRLAGGVAHDFNNLLTVVIAYCDLLEENVVHDRHLIPDIHEIKNAGTRASSLTRQLLAFSRKQVLIPRLFNISELVEDMSKMFSVILSANIVLRITKHDNPVIIKSDPGQLEQVLMNLVVNARDAMKQGDQLSISTDITDLSRPEHLPDPTMALGRYALITVRDTGSGMNEETLANVFEPFFTTKDEGKGTGLGLATVYGIVKQSGGVLDVESTLGEGTTFRIYLPLMERGQEVQKMKAHTKKNLVGVETILVVEDDDGVLNAAKMTLLRRGFSVLAACSAERAIELYEKSSIKIDVVVADLVMPGMNGHELAKELSRRQPDLKVIYTTGYAEHRVDMEDGSPYDDFIQKPFSGETLIQSIRGVLDGGSSKVRGDESHLMPK